MMTSRHILGMRTDATSYADATARVLVWARERNCSSYVCVANVHMVMESYDAADFREVVNNADLVTPDGVPLVWTLRRLGIKEQTRVYGPTLTLHVCEAAAKEGIPVGFYGATQETLNRLVPNLQTRFPGLRVAYAYAPPFRPLTDEEDEAVVEDLEASGARSPAGALDGFAQGPHLRSDAGCRCGL
jgi:N-acetylglucosaminyldiphosphoundecaprenol N-acetyl-beta-D-mannosaminyltransferase